MIDRIIILLVVVLFSGVSLAHDVIIKRNTHLRVEPSTDSISMKLLGPREEGKLLERHRIDGYYRIWRKDGIGYVWGNNVTILPEYYRSHWKHWTDEDGDCQDTRAEVLIAESKIPVTFRDGDECDKVIEGSWEDPFTGQNFTDPGLLDIDHMVPLQNAHRSGGWNWTYENRQDYANSMVHPEHLIAVSRSANRSKSAQGPDTWLPPNEDFLCQYVQEWEAIKSRWNLTISASEAEAIAQVKGEHC
jgi:hypothetical protein